MALELEPVIKISSTYTRRNNVSRPCRDINRDESELELTKPLERRRGAGGAAAVALSKDGEGEDVGAGDVWEREGLTSEEGKGKEIAVVGEDWVWDEDSKGERSDDFVGFKFGWDMSFGWRDGEGVCEKLPFTGMKGGRWTGGLGDGLRSMDLLGKLAKGKVCSSKITCRETNILPLEISRHLNP
ncbi:hypothetical protein F0562_030392 [Nyssa sinensis]|uniref:Uncharacterized protein n=1 Tax=Nyssa sinensis TaxID=561372 RepID=A0A5J5AYC9_9ASTE|nr:hypothetical protein F0562_030392 [Nyssa sinensis]